MSGDGNVPFYKCPACHGELAVESRRPTGFAFVGDRTLRGYCPCGEDWLIVGQRFIRVTPSVKRGGGVACTS